MQQLLTFTRQSCNDNL